jgi:hypothetical protein
MSRHTILGLAAAMLVGITLFPVDAPAHYRHHSMHAGDVCRGIGLRGWNPFSRNPGQQGYPGPHYGCDCYRAASGRAICRFF